MNLIEQARKDLLKITTNKSSGFAVDITFDNKDYNIVTVQGIYTKHSNQIDPQTGLSVTSKNCSVSVSEAALVAAGYTVRDTNKKLVNMYGHFVRFIDSTGEEGLYKIIEQRPDETVGLLVFILSDAENS